MWLARPSIVYDITWEHSSSDGVWAHVFVLVYWLFSHFQLQHECYGIGPIWKKKFGAKTEYCTCNMIWIRWPTNDERPELTLSLSLSLAAITLNITIERAKKWSRISLEINYNSNCKLYLVYAGMCVCVCSRVQYRCGTSISLFGGENNSYWNIISFTKRIHQNYDYPKPYKICEILICIMIAQR